MSNSPKWSDDVWDWRKGQTNYVCLFESVWRLIKMRPGQTITFTMAQTILFLYYYTLCRKCPHVSISVENHWISILFSPRQSKNEFTHRKALISMGSCWPTRSWSSRCSWGPLRGGQKMRVSFHRKWKDHMVLEWCHRQKVLGTIKQKDLHWAREVLVVPVVQHYLADPEWCIWVKPLMSVCWTLLCTSCF